MGFAGTGRKFEIHGIRLFEMQDGAIELERRFYDFTGLLTQIGVLRAKPARPEDSDAVGHAGQSLRS